MRDREIDEFESVFRRSIIPTIEVEKIRLDDIAILEEDCRPVAETLAARFGSRIFAADPQDVRSVIDQNPSLIITYDSGELVDTLLVATPIPTLILRGPVDFKRILVKIPGGRHDLIEQFSFAFALCEPGGLIRLLHVVERQRLKELAEALEVMPDVDTHADLLEAIKTRMDHLLRGAVRTGEDAVFTVEAAIKTGDPFQILPAEAKDFSLLILGSQASHDEFLESRAYALMQRVPDISVLAL